ncbi:hypothetical protein ACFFX1_08210 [Dactylosporangium sucinum]|nr:hypothetical protein [Dactylosporangium sucinum]
MDKGRTAMRLASGVDPADTGHTEVLMPLRLVIRDSTGHAAA